NILNIVDKVDSIEFGSPNAEQGKLAYEALKAAVNDLASTKIDVLVTAPINKDTIQSDEFAFPGHTEYLASMSNVEDHLMFLVSERMKIGVVTGHMPLKEVSESLSKEKILTKLKLMRESLMKDFGVPSPKIAVLGLNPHAGDNGLLGSEEKEIIQPALRDAQAEGMMVYGPYGADGFFGTAHYQQFDGVLAMYHDQGLAPFKALAFEEGVNFTAGLPIVRTSPDHGTAYDIAGKNEANEVSMRQAIFTACDIFKNRLEFKKYSSNPLVIQPRKQKSRPSIS
ncbi:MAG: 4-hydroxythreonine-4-phosphate dehydrogenase PdxA, partial [Bacteroidota bacterium]